MKEVLSWLFYTAKFLSEKRMPYANQISCFAQHVRIVVSATSKISYQAKTNNLKVTFMLINYILKAINNIFFFSFITIHCYRGDIYVYLYI